MPVRFRLTRPVAFTVVAATFVWFLAASSAPSPLYVVYQERFAFTEFTLTAVFAVYVLALIAALLVVGALSDHIGRRPVILAAVGLEIVALVLFLVAGGVGWLLAARIVQGVATGAATATLPATLVDLATRPGRAGLVNGTAPLTGLGLGGLACGALVEFAPAPTRLVWVLLLGGLLVAALLVALIPETIERRPGALASLRPRVGVPPRLRSGFAGVVPTLVASWSLSGLYLSLGPSVVTEVFGVHSHLVGGLVVAVLCLTGAVTGFLLRGRSPVRVLAPSAAVLAFGTLVTLVGVTSGLLLVATAGTVVAGAGFGAAAFATFGTLSTLAGPHERGELFAATYTLSYLAFSVPAMIAGLAATVAGLRPTALAYGGVIVAVGVVATVLGRRLAAPADRGSVPAGSGTR